jgi:hypothetical protein
MSVANRLGIPIEKAQQYGLLNGIALNNPDALFTEAFSVAEKDPDRGQALLAAALLSRAQHTSEGRLSAALSLISRLVVHADPMMTLGPSGTELRHELLPSGWNEMSQSWKKLRYAWREGMVDLLAVREEDLGSAEALNEITRLHPAEPEPVSVAIQEQFPHPKIAFILTVLGLGFTIRTVVREVKQSKRAKRSR